MNRHETPDPVEPVEPPSPWTQAQRVEKAIEVKVVVASLLTLLCGVAYAVIDAVSHSPHILDGLPEWSRFVILAAVPPVLTFLGGYATPSNRM